MICSKYLFKLNDPLIDRLIVKGIKKSPDPLNQGRTPLEKILYI
ncbi:hypothetical protein ADIS_2896 [Lunatimonas lonarensis]|uniref:Uncharacterized protein n=1 Tax=Lunatimonas lonarensis TaxID=1232681 RepID=R7ZQP6_9BACT|nr:hypothetical protein ADIS_2896 [Lunatimonas lonarensis]